MIRVITYGSYDVLHYGHIKLLERSKSLGDHLIVGVTSDDYDKARGKINLQQSLMERVEAVRATGIADEIIIEEYEGQKIDDILKYDIDIFTVGSDWAGHFDYLKEYCQVIYLPRTKGVSSTEIREKNRHIKLGLVGDTIFLNKVWRESKYVNGIKVSSLCTNKPEILDKDVLAEIGHVTDDYDSFINGIDAVYIRSHPQMHYDHIKKAINVKKHVLCESPITIIREETGELLQFADTKGVVLMEAVKTAYATAYERLLLLIKAGKIGEVVSIESTCTSIRDMKNESEWSSIHEWGPTAMLPIFQIFGTEYLDLQITSRLRENGHDHFTNIRFVYTHGIGSINVGDGVKSEGELIVSGTEGYIYVPAPWWKTDYFEVRYEDPINNKRYFYQLDGEGIRYEMVAFTRAIERGSYVPDIKRDVTLKISEVMEKFNKRQNMFII